MEHSILINKLLSFLDDSYYRSTVDNIPELPEELSVKIANIANMAKKECIKGSTFHIKWVKQGEMLQIEILLVAVDGVDLDTITNLMRSKLQLTFPQALPFFVDERHPTLHRFRLAMNDFVGSISFDLFNETSKQITKEIASTVGFTIENRTPYEHESTRVVFFKICRKHPRPIPAKSWVPYTSPTSE